MGTPLDAVARQDAAGYTPAATAPGSEELPPGLAALFPGGEFSIDMQVRDYELDQFGVVNNAVYSSYLQHGRHEALCALGLHVDEFARRGAPLALSSLAIQFRAPLRSRDRFRVTVSVSKVTPARLVLRQRILLKRASAAAAAAAAAEGTAAAAPGAEEEEEEEEELVVEAEAVVVFLDARYKPVRVPAQVARLFQAVQRLGEQREQQQQQREQLR